MWGRLDGKRTTPIKHIRLISGCRIAAYCCEQVDCHPTRFGLSFACASYAMHHPDAPHPTGEEEGRVFPAGVIRRSKTVVQAALLVSR